ncbi:RNA polymerase sigma factor SigI [Acetivibrio mesophilus]|uniref:RNA polymerase sigma factor SigI n=1 Tax=Acetivibrio mesophilus TaxID=2487273 RepID=A0A4Q0I2U7_9FIRM|nr:RNA polymerase sigma factor SigI [Acetivibrio mesophilus]ODM27255.1 RNA polymerase sigma-I factor [Clostridium sp. Bc-iso-3]RXE58047.1 RNA polymerase sigma factor SigI [Acetivibrio mesophilus]HHV29792.1 RNA polymerase sigma factor SigI [Clostridium sp.]
MYPVTINQRVESIKNDDDEINIFVEEYKPFIAACTQKVVGRYVAYGQDDELSIALMAFVEAIRSYDGAKGNFLSFSQNVIRRRIIDYQRKEKKYNTVININGYSDEEEEETDLSIAMSMEEYSKEEASEYRRLELQQLKRELEEWGISFFELVNISPKHKKTKRIYSDIIRFLLSRQNIIEKIKQKKYIPIAEIEQNLKIPRKTIERARKYIIAVVIICTGDYEFIKDYVNWEV